jgi:hypothetical protein
VVKAVLKNAIKVEVPARSSASRATAVLLGLLRPGYSEGSDFGHSRSHEMNGSITVPAAELSNARNRDSNGSRAAVRVRRRR